MSDFNFGILVGFALAALVMFLAVGIMIIILSVEEREQQSSLAREQALRET